MTEPQLFRETTVTPLRLPVEIRFEGSDCLRPGFTAQVAEEGMFVIAIDPQPVGSLFQFELRLDDIKSVRGFAEVVWIRLRTDGPGRPPGMGAQFRYLAGDGEAVLASRVRMMRSA